MKLRRTPIAIAALATLALTSFSSMSLADAPSTQPTTWGKTIGGYVASWDQFRAKVTPNFTQWNHAGSPDYIVDAFYKPISRLNQVGILGQKEEGDDSKFAGNANEESTTLFPAYTNFDWRKQGSLISLDSLAAYPQETGTIPNPWSKLGSNIFSTANANNARFISIGGWSYTNAWHDFFINAYQDATQSDKSFDNMTELVNAMLNTQTVNNFLSSLTSQYIVESQNSQKIGYNFDYENPGFMHTHTLEGLKLTPKQTFPSMIDGKPNDGFVDDKFTAQKAYADDPATDNTPTVNLYDSKNITKVEGFVDMEFYIGLINKLAEAGHPVSIALPIDFNAVKSKCAYFHATPDQKASNGPMLAAQDYESLYCDMANLPGNDKAKSTNLWEELFNALNKNATKSTADGVDLMAFDMHGQFDEGNKEATSASHTDANVIEDNIKFLQSVFTTDKDETANTDNYMKLIKLGIAPYGHEEIVKSSDNNGYGQTLQTIPYDTTDGKLASEGQDAISVATAWNSGDGQPFSVLDPANIDPMPDMGGMVDRTGIYAYTCLVDSTSCPITSFLTPSTVNPMLDASGQTMPTDFTTQNGDIVANVSDNGTVTDTVEKNADLKTDSIIGSWAYSTSATDMPYEIDGPLFGYQKKSQNPGAEVGFTYDSPTSVKSKIRNIVKRFGLGGVWFWDIFEDNDSRDATKSLYEAAKSELGSTATPTTDTIKIDLSASDDTHKITWTATAEKADGTGPDTGKTVVLIPTKSYFKDLTTAGTGTTIKCDALSTNGVLTCTTAIDDINKNSDVYELKVTAGIVGTGVTADDDKYFQGTTPAVAGTWSVTAEPSTIKTTEPLSTVQFNFDDGKKDQLASGSTITMNLTDSSSNSQSSAALTCSNNECSANNTNTLLPKGTYNVTFASSDKAQDLSKATATITVSDTGPNPPSPGTTAPFTIVDSTTGNTIVKSTDAYKVGLPSDKSLGHSSPVETYMLTNGDELKINSGSTDQKNGQLCFIDADKTSTTFTVKSTTEIINIVKCKTTEK